MSDQPASGSAEDGHVNGTPDPPRQVQLEVPASQKFNYSSEPNSSGANPEKQEHRPGKFPSRLTTSETLTLFVGVCSLVVSWLTYRNAADTSDLQKAVSNLATLTSESHRQADATQGQLTAIRDEQRAWLSEEAVVNGPLTIGTNGIYFLVEYKAVNLGHSPAMSTDFVIEPSLDPKKEASQDRTKFCKDIPNALYPSPFAVVVFPNQPTSSVVGGLFPEGEVNFWQARLGGLSRINVKGCVVYYNVWDRTPHRTGISYELTLVGQDGDAVAFPKAPSIISKENIRLKRMVFGMPIRRLVTKIRTYPLHPHHHLIVRGQTTLRMSVPGILAAASPW